MLFGIRNLAVRLVVAQEAANPLILKRIRPIPKFNIRQELVIMVLLLYNAQLDSIIATLIPPCVRVVVDINM
jgi:hypothetical protein